MKALFYKFATTLTILVIFLQPTAANAQSPVSTKPVSKGAASIYDQTSPTPATTSGTVQLIPVGNGQYKLAPQDPRDQSYPIKQAWVCDVPLVSGVCDVVNIGSTVFDWGTDLWNGAKCGVNPACWIKKAPFLMAGAVYEKAEGCSPDDASCHLQQLASTRDFNSPIQNGGGLSIIANITGQMMTLDLPVSTDLYIASLNPFRQVSASGFSDLTGYKNNIILTIWQNTRNAAYALSIAILVIVGFMIMLRSKLDPKTAVSVTNSLPKIVIMLILITFSLGISGLIIDFGRIVMNLALSLIPNVLTVGLISRLLWNTVFAIAVPFLMLILGIGLVSGGIGGFVVGLAGIIIAVVLVLILIFLCFYLVYVVMVRYAKFLLTTMFAPLVLLLLPFPGGGKYIVDFYRRQLAYILTIPIVIILVEISFQVAASCIPSPFSGGVLGSPMAAIGGAASVCASPLGNLNPFGFASAVAPVLGMGILLMAAKAPSIADEILNVRSGHGGGGHGSGAFGLLAVPLEGLENAGGLVKQYNYATRPMRALATRGMLRAQGITGIDQLGAPNARISGQAGALLQDYTGTKDVPTAAQLNNLGPNEKGKFDQKFLSIADQFAGPNPNQVATMVQNGDYLPLINDLRSQIGLGNINQSGQIANPQRASLVSRAAGRAFGVNEETIRQMRSKSEEEHINRSIIGANPRAKHLTTFGSPTAGTRGANEEKLEGSSEE